MCFKDKFITLAFKEAKKSESQFKIGCVIAKGKNVVSAHNIFKTHPSNLKANYNRVSIHAEVAAMIRARFDIKGGTLYVVRVNKKDQLTMAKPCSVCQTYMKEFGIKRCYWSDYDGEVHEVKIKDIT